MHGFDDRIRPDGLTDADADRGAFEEPTTLKDDAHTRSVARFKMTEPEVFLNFSSLTRASVICQGGELEADAADGVDDTGGAVGVDLPSQASHMGVHDVVQR